MIVKTWKNTKTNYKTGSGFGIYIGKTNRDHYFPKNLKYVFITMNGKEIKIKITKGFYEHCPEIRDKSIGQFLIRNNLNTWDKNSPHCLELIKINDCKFELSLLN